MADKCGWQAETRGPNLSSRPGCEVDTKTKIIFILPVWSRNASETSWLQKSATWLSYPTLKNGHNKELATP